MNLDWPLMRENINEDDLRALIRFLWPGHAPRLTNGPQVEAFEQEFAQVQGSKYAVMVNSGASANLITMQALKILHGDGAVLVPCITWVSDIAAVLHAGLEPVFVDVDPYTLGIDTQHMISKLDHTQNVRAVFITHCLGFNALPDLERYPKLRRPGVPLIEDCCESLGATNGSAKLGTYGLMANFSFYYAHHMSTIEGGMVTTDDERCYELLRMLRSHGLVREMKNAQYKRTAADECPDLDPEFIFTHPAYNVRPTEINAVIGRSQLPRLNYQNAKRTDHLVQFLSAIDPDKYRTIYRMEGSSNYALPLVLKHPDADLFSRVVHCLRECNVEFRKGAAGGGNQLRQPYAKERWGDNFHRLFPQAEHIHQYGLYIGNYPSLEDGKIAALCEKLNRL